MKALAVITAILGFLGVTLGAFGSHGLRGIVGPEQLSVWQTAVQYQMFHVLVLLSIVIAGSRSAISLLSISGWLFAGGAVVFSGSLFGGTLLLIGWLVLLFALIRVVAAQQATGE